MLVSILCPSWAKLPFPVTTRLVKLYSMPLRRCSSRNTPAGHLSRHHLRSHGSKLLLHPWPCPFSEAERQSFCFVQDLRHRWQSQMTSCWRSFSEVRRGLFADH